jgi:hypothetical protein
MQAERSPRQMFCEAAMLRIDGAVRPGHLWAGDEAVFQQLAEPFRADRCGYSKTGAS